MTESNIRSSADDSKADGLDPVIAREIISSLRMTQAPRRGTGHVAVAIEHFWTKLRETYIDITRGTTGGSIIYVMGDYGTGKTFLCNYTREQVEKLWDAGFATSYVAVPGFESLADLLGIYRQIVKNIRLPNSDDGIEGILLAFASRFPDKASLNQKLQKLNLGPDFAQKVRYLWDYQNRDTQRTITLRWILGEPGIQADLLHAIAEKGFAKLEETDIDDYLTGIKRIVQDLGAEGLFVFVDEAEQRLRPFDDDTVYKVMNNIKRIHNSVNQNEQFAQMIFLFAGTRELWARYMKKDEPQRQRMQIQEDIPRLAKGDYVELGKKVAHVYDVAFGSTISSRLSDQLLSNWIEFVAAGSVDRLTPRDFLREKPSPAESFLSKLDQMRLHAAAEDAEIFVMK